MVIALTMGAKADRLGQRPALTGPRPQFRLKQPFDAKARDMGGKTALALIFLFGAGDEAKPETDGRPPGKGLPA
jgi:hypothetical protein